jgi:hypothetical protein
MPENANEFVFFLKFILELTIVRRDALSRGVNIDEKIFRFIHIASSCGSSSKNRKEFFMILDGYTKEDPQLKKMIEFVTERAQR